MPHQREGGRIVLGADLISIGVNINRMRFFPVLFQFKTRCLVMMKSMKSCKREIKALSNIQATVSTSHKILMCFQSLSDPRFSFLKQL